MNEPKGFRFALSIVVVLFVMIVFSHASKTRAGVDEVFAAADAGTTFNAKCAKCHGRDGRGKTTRGRLAHARDLTLAQWQNDVTDERLFNSISNGRGKMPGFKKHLSEAEIDALVAYVRRLKR